MTYPYVITNILALAAIVAPVIVAVINNRQQTRLRKMEIGLEREKESLTYLRNIYEDFIKSAGAQLHNPSDETKRKYLEAYSLAFAYFPPKSHEMLIEINKCIESGDEENATKQIVDLSKWMSSLMKDLVV